MSCDNNSTLPERCCSLVNELRDSIDSVITIYTEGCCFTGLLVGVSNDAVKIITQNVRGCPSRSLFGKVTIICINQIEAVTFCNTSA